MDKAKKEAMEPEKARKQKSFSRRVDWSKRKEKKKLEVTVQK